jgi:hypothetical protein
MKFSPRTCWSILLLATTATANFSFDTPKSTDELVAAYPDLESNRTGNPLILCPFLRLLERSGRLDSVRQEGYVVDNDDLKDAAEEFGCDGYTACGPVIDLVSSGQEGQSGIWQYFSLVNPFDSPRVDLERLWDAPPVSHECGFTFEKEAGQEGVWDFDIQRYHPS